MSNNFKFLNPEKLIDNDLELILVEKIPATPAKKYVPCYEFDMRSTITGIKLGYFRFRVGDAKTILRYPCHIGYGVKKEFRGQHYSARSIRLILPLARAHGVKELTIGCKPENIASRRICELAGAELREIVNIPKEHQMYQEGIHKMCRYSIDLSE